MTPKSEARFRIFVYITIVLTYLVILAGAVVRTTQSGMGCPDWPKCFGQYIPPTDVSQLPANYQQIYADRGYADTTFDAFHTWTEYINRLFGALLGIAIFITLLLSIPYLKTQARVFWLSLLSFFLIGFQAWLGKLVVASNLAPVKITVHMVAALVLLALLIYIFHLVSPKIKNNVRSSKLMKALYVALALTVVQIMLGTQVREEVDSISKALNHLQRETWADKLSLLFKFHRSFSLLVLALNAWIVYQSLKLFASIDKIKLQASLIALLIAAEIVVGAVLGYFSFPAALQPVHLLLASFLFGIQFRYILLLTK